MLNFFCSQCVPQHVPNITLLYAVSILGLSNFDFIYCDRSIDDAHITKGKKKNFGRSSKVSSMRYTMYYIRDLRDFKKIGLSIEFL
jgi:hypothetical protein